MTVRGLLSSVDARELAEWQAYERLEPWGEQRADLRQAITSCLFANAWRDAKAHKKPFEHAEFMPFADKPKQSEKQQVHIATAIRKAIEKKTP